MPLVMVHYNPSGLGLVTGSADTMSGVWLGYSQSRIKLFTGCLPSIVAAAFNVPEVEEAPLTLDDVEVHINGSKVGDVSKYALDITILANLYAQRLANLDERRRKIGVGVEAAMRACFPGAEGAKACVRVLLCPGSFGDFVI